MGKYRVEAGAFVSRLVNRTIIVHADTPEEAEAKAIDKFLDMENKLKGGGIPGSVNIDFIERIE
jgi:hypothetical protein